MTNDKLVFSRISSLGSFVIRNLFRRPPDHSAELKMIEKLPIGDRSSEVDAIRNRTKDRRPFETAPAGQWSLLGRPGRTFRCQSRHDLEGGAFRREPNCRPAWPPL